MKGLLKTLVISFVAGVTSSIIAVSAFAGIAFGDYRSFYCNGSYYKSLNSIGTFSKYILGCTNVYSQDEIEKFPAGDVGIQCFVYSVSYANPVLSSKLEYNSSAQSLFSVYTPEDYNQTGTFYTQGEVWVYNSGSYKKFTTIKSRVQSRPEATAEKQ
ncbi:MAG: hypothetical protein HDT44_11935 [Ruminococcaceae bacterium]|nr:hypothetical protein [Oscillospiraceae bacterium]